MGLCITLYQVSVVLLFSTLFLLHGHHYLYCELISIFVPSSEGPRAERFSLNPTSGELRTASPLRWAERAEYSFTVTAADHGTPGLSATCQLRIQVNIKFTFYNLQLYAPEHLLPLKNFLLLETKATLVTEPETVTSTHYLSPFAFLAASNFLKLCTK